MGKQQHITEKNEAGETNKRSDKSHDNLVRFAEEKLRVAEDKGQRRVLKPVHRRPDNWLEREGMKFLSFCDNDYLALSHDERVIVAGKRALEEHGAGAGASRLVTGDVTINRDLEVALARVKGTEAARVFGSGYLANVGTIPALVGRQDVIIMDELSHACMHAGARLSGAEIHIFRHNDVDHMRDLLMQLPFQQRKLVLTETIFSMDGDRAPLHDLHALCEDHNGWLMTDDAHGLGVVQMDNPAPIQLGTLSKAVGAYGGYVCGPEALIELLISRARSFVYTTGLPPAVLASALEAVSIIEREPELGGRACENAAYFCRLMNLPEPESCIVPMIIGPEGKALSLSDHLLQDGFLVTAIRPPTVPEGTSRLRFTFTAGHKREDIEALVNALRRGSTEE